MKRKQIVLGAVLSVFILVSTPVFANIANTEMQPTFKTVLMENQNNAEKFLFDDIVDSSENKERLNLLENSEVEFELDGGKSTLLWMKPFLNNPKLSIAMKSHYPILSEDYLNYAYNLGFKISKNLDTPELKSMAHINIFKDFRNIYEILNNIEKYNDCGCNDKESQWDFPVLCTILYFIITPIAIFLWILGAFTRIRELNYLALKLLSIGEIFDCWWT